MAELLKPSEVVERLSKRTLVTTNVAAYGDDQAESILSLTLLLDSGVILNVEARGGLLSFTEAEGGSDG